MRSTSARRILPGIGTGERYGREHDGKGKDTIRSISSGREVNLHDLDLRSEVNIRFMHHASFSVCSKCFTPIVLVIQLVYSASRFATGTIALDLLHTPTMCVQEFLYHSQSHTSVEQLKSRSISDLKARARQSPSSRANSLRTLKCLPISPEEKNLAELLILC